MTTWTRAERIAPTTSSATMAAAGGSKTGDAVRGMCPDINNILYVQLHVTMFSS